MRYLIDTNIFVYLALDIEMLSRDVKAILEESDTRPGGYVIRRS